MSAVPKAQESSAPHLKVMQPWLLGQFDLLATAPSGVAKLRRLILTLAVQGKLVPQDPNETPAIFLVDSATLRPNSVDRDRMDHGVHRNVSSDEPKPVPPGWEVVRLHQVADTRLGKMLDKAKNRGLPRPYLRNTNVQWGRFALDDVKAMNIEDSELDEFRLASGDLLVCEGGEPGRCAVWRDDDLEMYFQKALHRVRPRTGVSSEYIAIALESAAVTGALSAHFTGATIKHFVGQALQQYTFPLPPSAEQARIVARVDELMRLCDALEAKGRLEAEQHTRLLGTLLGTLTDSSTPEELGANWQRVADHFDLLLDRPEAVDALERAILQLAVRGLLVRQEADDAPAQELSVKIQRRRKSKRKITPLDSDAVAEAGVELPGGWTWCSVDEVSADEETAITDGPFGANLKTEHYIEAEGFRVVRLQNIGEGRFRDEHRAYINEERFSRLRRHAVFPGDIVVAGLVDESIRCCIVPVGMGPAIVKADCYRFAVHEDINAEYVCMYLSSETAHQFASAHHHGLTLTRIGLGNFRSIPVPLPPANEQRRIVARVAELRRLCSDLRQRLSSSQITQAHLAEVLIDEVA